MSKPLTRILYVEDEPDIRSIATMALEMVGGFQVIACESGPDALAKAPASNADLLLLDVMMPGMDGPATLRALRETFAMGETPVIFMTAKVQPSEVAEYRALGALDVLAKPFDPMRISEEIRRIWTHANAL